MNSVIINIFLLIFFIIIITCSIFYINNRKEKLHKMMKKLEKKEKTNEKILNDVEEKNLTLQKQQEQIYKNKQNIQSQPQNIVRENILPQSQSLTEYVNPFLRGGGTYDYSYPMGFYRTGPWTPVGYISTQDVNNDNVLILETRRRDDGYYDYRAIKSQEGPIAIPLYLNDFSYPERSWVNGKIIGPIPGFESLGNWIVNITERYWHIPY